MALLIIEENELENGLNIGGGTGVHEWNFDNAGGRRDVALQ